jgi:hypothetical protein
MAQLQARNRFTRFLGYELYKIFTTQLWYQREMNVNG